MQVFILEVQLIFQGNVENESSHDMELETTATWLEIEALKQEPKSPSFNVSVHTFCRPRDQITNYGKVFQPKCQCVRRFGRIRIYDSKTTSNCRV